MSINLLEDNELSALAPSRLGNRRFADQPEQLGFLGIGEGKSKAKKASASISSGAADSDESFKQKMLALYNTLKGNKYDAERTAAINTLNSPGALPAVRAVMADIGGFGDLSGLQKHNKYVRVYRDYFVPNDPKNPLSCETLSDLINRMDIEIRNYTELQTGGTASAANKPFVDALTLLRGKYQKLYGSQQCQLKAEKAAEEAVTQETLSTLAKATQATQAASSTQSSNLKYVAYGVGGLLVVAALYLLFKNK